MVAAPRAGLCSEPELGSSRLGGRLRYAVSLQCFPRVGRIRRALFPLLRGYRHLLAAAPRGLEDRLASRRESGARCKAPQPSRPQASFVAPSEHRQVLQLARLPGGPPAGAGRTGSVAPVAVLEALNVVFA